MADEIEYQSDQPIKVIKFVEVSENSDEIAKQKSGQNVQKEADANKSTTAIVETAGADVKETNAVNHEKSLEDVDKSDRSSNISGSSVADDLRQLKDFKALISEKTVPKSIKILQRTVFIAVLIFLGISSWELSSRIAQRDDLLEGFSAIYSSYARGSLMADVNYNVRLLDLLAKNMLQSTTMTIPQLEQSIKTNLSTSIDNLQTNQFDVIKARIKMEARIGSSQNLEKYDISFQLQNGDIKIY